MWLLKLEPLFIKVLGVGVSSLGVRNFYRSVMLGSVRIGVRAWDGGNELSIWLKRIRLRLWFKWDGERSISKGGGVKSC